jgi:hypothetical protein
MLVFSTQLWDLYSTLMCCPFFCPSPLLSSSTPLPPPCVIKYTVYKYAVCKGGGGYEVLGLRQINHLPLSPYTDQFLGDIFCFGVYLYIKANSPWIGLSLLDALLWIRIGFNAYPDPEFRVDPDPVLDPGI